MSAMFEFELYFNDESYSHESTTSSFFPSCLLAGKKTKLPSPLEIVNLEKNYTGNKDELIESVNNGNAYVTIKDFNGNVLLQKSQTVSPVIFSSSTNTAEYFYYRNPQDEDSGQGWFTKFTYTFYSAENKYPTKPWTIKGVVERILDLAEPLFYGQTARYKLDPEQAEWLDSIRAPEFTMTRDTLREQLRVVGAYIHAEPRLIIKYHEDTKIYEGGIIHFDKLGEEKKSWLEEYKDNYGKEYPYVYRRKSQSINDYCTSVDSITQNMVNQLRYADGVITEPRANVFKTMRTDSINVRVQDTNAIAETQEPIQKVMQIVAGVYDSAGGWYVIPQDITAYLFEKTAYDANLSSYDGSYPYSKAYAIYYERGTKNIGGFFFRVEKALAVQARYAIANILASTSGLSADDIFKILEANPCALAVQVKYIPIYSAHVSHGKQLMQADDILYSKIYNQTENMIETKYFGENIKGVAARLGNAEETRTYLFDSIDKVPNPGETLDGMKISAVRVSVMPAHIKCTVELTKDYNRINEYVGVSSVKRTYDISETQVYDRNILLHEYCIFTRGAIPTDERYKSGIFHSAMDIVLAFLNPYASDALSDYGKITTVDARCINKSNTSDWGFVQLPVIASALGNTATYTWRYKDNYSAGTHIENHTSGEVSGYWQSDIPYTDAHGRAYMYAFSLLPKSTRENSQDVSNQTPMANPDWYWADVAKEKIGTEKTGFYILRKDNRERISFNLELEMKTADNDLIIGSGIAANLASVSGIRGNVANAKIFFSKEEVNKFKAEDMNLNDTEKFPASMALKMLSDSGYGSIESGSIGAVGSVPADAVGCKGWVIAIPPAVEGTTQYEDDDGNLETVTTYSGGDILLACNEEITEGYTFKPIKFWLSQNIYN